MSRLVRLPAHGIGLAGLAAGQSALLAQIRQNSHETDQKTKYENQATVPRGLQVYRANARMGAALALRAAYPVLAQLLGEDSFEAMARHFWHTHPPMQGDWAQWGADLPAFLAKAAQLSDLPYLPDVARLEWALHQCAGAADALQDAPSFALLAQHAPEQICLRLGSACLVASAYPVLRIVQAHSLAGVDLAALADLSADIAIASHTNAAHTEATVVWRSGFAPQMRVVQGAELAFIGALLAGYSLAAALDAAGDGLDFSAWLTNCFQNGLVLAAAVHTSKASQ